jgi:two-component system cell cycle sensor histidine kinase/response regulator CckA
MLIAEDEPDLLYLFQQGLEMIGATVLTAPDGEKAWELFEEQGGKIDLVISDIFMPGMNGVQLMTKVKNKHPDVPVFLITGYAHLRTLVEESNHKPDAYLEKPFNLPDLFRLIKKLVPRDLEFPDI